MGIEAISSISSSSCSADYDSASDYIQMQQKLQNNLDQDVQLDQIQQQTDLSLVGLYV